MTNAQWTDGLAWADKEKIAMAVADRFRVTVTQLRAKGRTQRFANPRHIAMVVMRGAGGTLAEIGRYFERDHTTVIYAEKKVAGHSVLAQAAAAVLAELKQDEVLKGAADAGVQRADVSARPPVCPVCGSVRTPPGAGERDAGAPTGEAVRPGDGNPVGGGGSNGR